MTAWESLVAGSTIATGTAWEHLQAQGGGGHETVFFVDGGLSGAVDQAVLSGVMADEGALSGSAEMIELTATMIDDTLFAMISSDALSGTIEGIELTGDM